MITSVELKAMWHVILIVTDPVLNSMMPVLDLFNQDTPPHRCVNDETVTFLNTTMGANGEASTIRYSFDMFRFVVEPHDLYLHCRVRLCSLDDDEPCIPVSSLAFGAVV